MVVRLTVARLPSSCGGPCAPDAIGMRCSSSIELTRCCFAWMITGYRTPFMRFSQKLVVAVPLPDSETDKLFATSCAVRPTCCAAWRSASTMNRGASRI